MSHILKDLVLFHQDKLPETRRKEIVELMKANPAFKDALLGLAFIEEELSEKENIAIFLTRKQETLRQRIFANKNQ